MVTHISFNRKPEEIARYHVIFGIRVAAISGGVRAVPRTPPEIATTRSGPIV